MYFDILYIVISGDVVSLGICHGEGPDHFQNTKSWGAYNSMKNF